MKRVEGPSKKGLKIRTWIVLFILSASIIPILLLAGLMARQHYLDQIADAREKHLLIARALANAVDGFLDSHRLALESLADELSGKPAHPSAELQGLISRFNRRYSGFESVILTDRSGKSIAVDPMVGNDGKSNIGVNYGTSQWFVRADYARNSYVAEPALDQVTRAPYVAISVPLRNDQDEIVGVLAGNINLNEIRKLLQGYTLGKTGFPVLSDQKGRILVHPRRDWEKELKDLSNVPYVKKILKEDTGVVSDVPSTSGERAMSGYATVKTVGWKVGMPQSLSEVRRNAFESVLRSLVWVPGLVVLLIACVVVLSRKFSAPLLALAQASSAAVRGDLVPVTIPRGWLPAFEVRQLSEAFNRMVASIRRRTEELASLNRVTKIMNSELDLRDVFQACGKEINKVIPFDLLVCHLVDEKSNRYGRYAIAGVLDTDRLEPRVPGPIDKGSVTEWVVAHRRPAVVPDILEENRFPWGRDHYLRMGMRSFVALPLFRQDKVSGVLHFARKVSGAYTAEQLDYLTALADAFSNALANAQLYEDQVQTAKRLATSNRIAKILASSPDIDKIYEAFSEEIALHVHYDSIQILLLDRMKGVTEIVSVLEKGLSSGIAKGYRIELEKTVGLKTAIEGRRPFLRSDNPHSENFSQELDAEGFRSSLLIPLIIRDEVIAILGLLHKQPNQYHAQHIDILGPIGEQLAIAMDQSQLFKKTETLLREQRLLSEVISEITVLDLDELLGKLAERVRVLLNAEVCFIRLLNASGQNELRAVAAPREEFRSFLSARKDGSTGVSSWIVERQQPVLVNDSQKDARFLSVKGATGVGVQAFLGVPIISKDGMSLGMLGVFSSGEVKFSEDQLAFLERVAKEASVAIQNARLFSELAVANQWKEEVVANVSHELRTPLGVIIGNADLLIEKVFGPLNDRQQKSLEKVKVHANHLAALVNNILMFAQMERGRLSTVAAPFHPDEVLGPIRSLGAYQSEKKTDIAFRCEVETPLPMIRTDKTMLVAILENLLGNAFKFTEKGEVALRVRDLGEEKKLAFSVSDTGIGIADQDLPIIFDQFRQIDGSPTRRHGGFGLGLSLVKRYLDLLHGEIEVVSAPGIGSIFTVRIPHEI